MLKVLIAPVTPFQQNCSIVWCDETMEGTAVDPGGDFERLKQAIAEQGIKVTKVLLTHGHVDHASAAGTMADHYGVKIEGPHRDDLFLIEGLPDSGRKYNFPVYKPFVPDRWLEGGETVSLGNLTFDVVHCPGHTPGHVSVMIESEGERAVITGDMTHHPCQMAHPDWSLGDNDPKAAARQALPEVMRDGAEVSEDDDGAVAVKVTVPTLLPDLPELKVGARSGLGDGGG